MYPRLVMFSLTMTVLGIAAAQPQAAADDRPLIHWAFDQSAAGKVEDLSGNGLHGSVAARLVASPSGQAVMMDGTSKTIVSVKLPENKRFGKDSWTLMAMLKPIRFDIQDKQNQRRIFSFGVYPDAYLVIDINQAGRLTCYFCYRDTNGKTVSAGGSSQVSLEKETWSHVAIVCNRENHRIETFINGFASGGGDLPQKFDGNFVLGGQLTIGSGWHNYWGLMDEVKVFRQALSPQVIDSEFTRLKPVFGVVESESVLAAKMRLRLETCFGEINAAWSEQRFDDVRRLCQVLIDTAKAPDHFRSYAHLRIAQSYLAQNNHAAARSVYQAIAETDSYPSVHRDEAREAVKELERVSRGLPARDPAATRTEVNSVANFAAEVFVAPKGNDADSGSSRHPFATLERARDEVRKLKGHGVSGPIAVTILPGEYKRVKTLKLTAADSGSESAPIIYRAKQKGTAVFYGGQRLTGFAPVTDAAVLRRLPNEARGKVYQCDLKKLGITDFGELKVRGFAQPPSPPTLELYVDRVPLTIARYPNEGYLGIRKLINPGSRATGEPSAFEYDSDRHERWVGARDAWLFGYFHFLWADATIKIGKIDPKTRTLTTAEPYHYGGRGMSTKQGIQYYVFNLLEEIDLPGEWYLDRQTGMLYLYPPTDLDNSTVELGMLSVPMIDMEQVSHVRFSGLTFDLARYNGIVAKDCYDCDFLACTVERFAGNGIMIHGGTKNRLIGCDIHTIGRRATEVIGGDRETLTPGGHLVENCQIHDFGRIDRTYTPAIQLEGVGHRVAHNLMYNAPSSAMRIEGNDHLIEYNEVHSMVRESDDQGALELFRNPTYRGVVFRHNYLHNIGKTGTEAAVHGQAAIRFDDAISGMLVYGNVFYRCANGNFGAIQMNSGRDNLMDNNLFVDCKQGISGGWNPGNNVWKGLRAGSKLAGFYQNKLYLNRYPKIATMLERTGREPRLAQYLLPVWPIGDTHT